VTFAAGVRVVKNVLVPMRDGVHLAADLYLPGPEPLAPLPVSWSTSPTAKDEVVPGTHFFEYLARHGYVVARVDIRGTGASEGVNTRTSTCPRNSSTAMTQSSGSPRNRSATGM
jgi:uncharacterized protein